MFLADENISPKTIEFIKSLGYKILSLKDTNLLTFSDSVIIEYAKKNKLVFITFDKHFSNITKYPPKEYYGIIRIRIHPPKLDDVHRAIKMFLNDFDLKELKGSLVVIEKEGYRVRR